ncbi:MAG: hypothetical protein ACKODG_04210 [Betaproteobacteria bacterium]
MKLSLIAPVALGLFALAACQPLSPEEQARLRGKTPPAVSLSVSPNADAASSRIEPAVLIGKEGFRDNFDRAELGADWLSEGRAFRIESGKLVTRATGNRGLWLRRALPRDVRIDFTVRAEGTAADIKLEIFGDGQAADSTSGYIVIFGGWGNTLNVIARRNENGADRALGPTRTIVKGQTYRMRIERRGRVVEAYADDVLLARLDDPAPLEGPGHQFFAFNGWQSELWYDDLVITPL